MVYYITSRLLDLLTQLGSDPNLSGGDKVSTGIVEAEVACRGSHRPRKTGGKFITADTELAMAA